MTTKDIHPDTIKRVVTSGEPVIVETQTGWRIGRRSHLPILAMGCLARVTVTEEGELFHGLFNRDASILNREEANSEMSRLESRAREIRQELERL